jgi:hypothetical protein
MMPHITTNIASRVDRIEIGQRVNKPALRTKPSRRGTDAPPPRAPFPAAGCADAHQNTHPALHGRPVAQPLRLGLRRQGKQGHGRRLLDQRRWRRGSLRSSRLDRGRSSRQSSLPRIHRPRWARRSDRKRTRNLTIVGGARSRSGGGPCDAPRPPLRGALGRSPGLLTVRSGSFERSVAMRA